MTSDGVRSFGFDQYNRLISAGTASFDYDPLGRLYQSTGASGTERRVYDGAAMIAVYSSTGSVLERGARPGPDPGARPACVEHLDRAGRQARGRGCRGGDSDWPLRLIA
ncbi:MAG: hypothetical protein ABL308_05595 [Oceanicaulis sp.]